MTAIDYAARPVAPARPGAFDIFRTVFDAPALFLKRRFIAAHTYKELSALSDRQLDDIGLVRAQISDISADMASRF